MPRVLVVDDEPTFLEFMVEILEKHSLEVRTVANGDDCLELFSSDGDTIDLVLLDLTMPGTDGITTLKALRKRFSPSELPIIMISGWGKEDHVIEAIRAGANDFINKPLRTEIAIARTLTQLAIGQHYKKLKELKDTIKEGNHSIRNPLTIALAGLAQAQTELCATCQQNPMLNKIENALVRIANIVKSMQELDDF